MKVRLNLRVDPYLLRWARSYATRTGNTVTGVFMEGIRLLREREGGGTDVPQL
jgi:hypothetical protein